MEKVKKHTETEYKLYALKLSTSDYTVYVVGKNISDVLKYYDEGEIISLEYRYDVYLSDGVVADIIQK